MQTKAPLTGSICFLAGAACAAAATKLDARTRHLIRDRALSRSRRAARRVRRRADYMRGQARGVAHMAATPLRGTRQYDDVTLAHKVESEIFRAADAPKGKVDVNVNDGIVELRGMVERPDELGRLASAAARVEGVGWVRNLLHTPGTAPGHSPPSDPAVVRERIMRRRASPAG